MVGSRSRRDAQRLVLGVDPGVKVTGFGVVARGRDRRLRLLECGAIRTAPGKPLAERLLEIFDGLIGVIERQRPDVMCVEGVFYGRNVRTTVVLGHARGAALLAAARKGLPVVEYPPAEIKNAVVGSGSADKEQVAFMIQKHLALARPPTPADACDGVAAALCYLFREGLEEAVAASAREARGGAGAGAGS